MSNSAAFDSSNLHRLRVEILYKQSALVQTIGIVNAGIFCFITREHFSEFQLGCWFLFVLFVYGLRFSIQMWFRVRYLDAHRPFDSATWENIFACGTFLSGVTWSLAGTWLLPNAVLAQHAFLGFLLAGTTAGAAVAYCTSMRSMQAFLLPAILPFALNLIVEGGAFQYSMAILLGLYVITVSTVMLRMNRSVTESIHLRFEKDKLLAELRDTQAKITQSARMAALGEMAGGMAHEINTPLGNLQFELEQLAKLGGVRGIDGSSLAKASERMSKVVARIAKIVGGLQVFAREGQIDGLEPVQIQKLVIDTMDLCQNRFRNHGVALQVDTISSDLWIFCQTSQVRQVLLNLLTNAFEAVQGRSSGKVRVEVLVNSNEIQMIVTDNGHGIPTEIQDKIMQPFFTTKETGLGTGLGLSVSRGIVQSHGGRIEFESSEEGSRFVVILPKDPALNAA